MKKSIMKQSGFKRGERQCSGHRNLRSFVEEHVSTPYLVVDSHGYPDHIGENLKVDESTRENKIGFETYCSSYEVCTESQKLYLPKIRKMLLCEAC